MIAKKKCNGFAMSGTLAMVLSALTMRSAWPHGDPIVVTNPDGTTAIITNDSNPLDDAIVYLSDLEPLGALLFTDVPGFSFHGFSLNPSDVVSFEMVDHLWYWNYNSASLTTPHRDEALVVERQTTPFPSMSIQHNPLHQDGKNEFIPGFVIETISALSGNHNHRLAYFFEDVPQPLNPNDFGVYAIMMRLVAPGYQKSAPFMILFDHDGMEGTGAAFSTAVEEIQQRAFYRLYSWLGGAGDWLDSHWEHGEPAAGPPGPTHGAEVDVAGSIVVISSSAAAETTSITNGEVSLLAAGVLTSTVAIGPNGLLSGAGAIVGNVTNGGTIQIGAAPLATSATVPEPSAGCLLLMVLCGLRRLRSTCRGGRNQP